MFAALCEEREDGSIALAPCPWKVVTEKVWISSFRANLIGDSTCKRVLRRSLKTNNRCQNSRFYKLKGFSGYSVSSDDRRKCGKLVNKSSKPRP